MSQQNHNEEAQFKALFNHISTNVISKDPDKAIEMADSLLNNCPPNYKYRYLLLKSNAYVSKNLHQEAIKTSEAAFNLSSKANDFYWSALIALQMSRICIGEGLYIQSEDYLEKADKYLDLIEDPADAEHLKTLVYTEKGKYYLSDLDHNHEKALYYFHKAGKIMKMRISKSNPEELDSRYIVYAHNNFNIGEIYFYLNIKDSAFFYYNTANNYFKKSKLKDKKTEATNNLGLERSRQDFSKDSMIARANELLEIANATGNSYMKYRAYDALIDTLDIPESSKKMIRDTYRLGLQEQNGDALLNYSYSKKIKKEREDIYSLYKIVSVVLMLAMLFLSVLVYRSKKMRRKERIKYNILIEKIDNQEDTNLNNIFLNTEPEQNNLEKSKNEKASISITREKELKLLSQLDEFEKQRSFNKKAISLAYLASEFDTNSRYISYVVNKHKNTDFNNYINSLRINYIIEKIRTEKKYRRYKIVTLAEECGYSSHSKFSTIFKSLTGLSPSSFIEFVNDEIKD